MIISVLEEHEDGSATVRLEDVSPDLMRLIVQTGLLKLLTDALDEAEANNKLPALLRPKE